ncbi:SubName: Full=Uncharacterized protein {ECO:0000313/EMBL:CCA76622.1} [Serendipita indica DSM 11827]|uniref:CoA-binding domain-containing protein n=1 Tax=Serendipita indica (strain DSM 11827) TaxID=1109443 RepID=G4TZ79_SERID|nr:SubName: Full=Uncharacterized protein {ECO:0000313/EMBL:CCA76622.1} [Serendipita indica DSM 11827]CCA76622.1 hypothetical protein PIIN_10613 [Serendipita indica DSM 11827]
MPAMTAIQRAFLAMPKFAVLGASNDQTKYGNKVLRWYKTRNLEVTPINPKVVSIEGLETVSSLEALPEPKSTSVSIVTPSKVTLDALRSAKSLGIPYIWIQPGAADDAVADYIANDDYLQPRVVYGGPCILVLGDGLLGARL